MLEPDKRRILSALTVDVEDYFQVTAFERHVDRARWSDYPSRVVANTQRLLDMFAERAVRGTFFVLGWVAEHYPDLVRAIDAAGHEIGSHSYWHRLVYEQTPDEFRSDLRRSKAVLEDVTGKPVTMYRAPTFSITERSRWALEILVEEGIEIDSSIFPIRGHDRYGMSGCPLEVHRIETAAGSIWEAPLSVARWLGVNWPAAGGGYFRLYPYALTRHLIRRVHAADRPLIFYIHPWEIDPEQPRQTRWTSRYGWRHYLNLARTAGKLQTMLSEFAWSALSDMVATSSRSLVPNGVHSALAVGELSRT